MTESYQAFLTELAQEGRALLTPGTIQFWLAYLKENDTQEVNYVVAGEGGLWVGELGTSLNSLQISVQETGMEVVKTGRMHLG